MTDPIQQLTDARPTQAELDAMWAPERRAAVLDRVLDGRTRGRRRLRIATAIAAAAAAVVAIALVPGLVATLGADQDLKDVAARVESAPQQGWLEPGTFVHVRTTSRQVDSWLVGNRVDTTTQRESWIDWQGRQLVVDTRPDTWVEYHVFEPARDGSFGNPTPEFVASLPDDPAALRAYLDQHVSGSNSHTEAIFGAITDLARSHMLPARTWAAALVVLADLPNVATDEVSVDGRRAVQVTYRSIWGALTGRHTVTVDRETGRVLSEHEADPGGTYDSTTTLTEVVDAVPPEVLAVFEEHPGGYRECLDPAGCER